MNLRSIASGARSRSLTVDALRPVLEHDGLGCSLYLPTVPGRQSQEDSIQLKNLLADLADQLADEGAEPRLGRQLVDRLAEEAWAALEDGAPRGLAWFVGEGDELYSYSLPRVFAPEAWAGSGFRIRPLLPLLSGDGRFHLLALDVHGVRLFAGSRHDLREVELPDAPPPLAETLPEDANEHRMHFSSFAPAGDQSNFLANGGYDHDTRQDERIREWFRRVDHALHRLLHGDRTPFVLVGVERLHHLFRDVTRRPVVLDEGLGGSPDGWEADGLHAAAWSLVEPRYAIEVQAARGRFGDGLPHGRSVTLLSDILAAADEGRIDTLFVPRVGACWGRRDDGGGVEFHAERAAGDVDLHDLAARRTLLAGGTVHAVPTDDIPGNEGVAAILRW